jgi:purine-binding chemotaxis protein CheW
VKGKKSASLVVFLLDGTRCAVRTDCVERVLPMAGVTRIPGAPEIALGSLNLHGELIPVLDVRLRFGFASRPPDPSDKLLVAATVRRRLALPVDDVLGVEEQAVTPAETLLPGLHQVAGVVALADGVLYIHDLERFLSLDEENLLDAALAAPPAEREQR